METLNTMKAGEVVRYERTFSNPHAGDMVRFEQSFKGMRFTAPVSLTAIKKSMGGDVTLARRDDRFAEGVEDICGAVFASIQAELDSRSIGI